MLFVNACDFKFTQSFCDIPYVDFWYRPGTNKLLIMILLSSKNFSVIKLH